MKTSFHRTAPPRLNSPLKPLKFLVVATAALSIFSAVCSSFYTLIPHHLMPSSILSLSKNCVDSGYLFQFFTYSLIQQSGSQPQAGVTFLMLLNLLFSCYMLFAVGSFVIAIKGIKHFFTIYPLAVFAAGAGAYLAQTLFHTSLPYAGNGAATFSLLLVWVAFSPDTIFHLFMTIPVRAKTLFIALFWMLLLISLSQLDLISFFAQLFSIVAVYFYILLAWKVKTPFTLLHPFEELLVDLAKRRPGYHNSKHNYSKAKIFELRTGEAILTDAQYLEYLEEKITLHGRKSLSFSEKAKLFFLRLRLNSHQD